MQRDIQERLVLWMQFHGILLSVLEILAVSRSCGECDPSAGFKQSVISVQAWP